MHIFCSNLSKKHDLINGANDATKEASSTPKNDNIYSKVVKQVLLIPGKIISMSILLNHKSIFWKQIGLTTKPLMERVVEEITAFSLGEVETYNISRNKNTYRLYFHSIRYVSGQHFSIYKYN